MSNRFSEVTDAQHAVVLMRKVHKTRNLQYDTDAPAQGHPHPHAGIFKKNEVEKRAVDIFVYGFFENLLKLKILKENPANLEVAITTAANEQNLRRRFSLQTRHHGIPDEEHIEVDHS